MLTFHLCLVNSSFNPLSPSLPSTVETKVFYYCSRRARYYLRRIGIWQTNVFRARNSVLDSNERMVGWNEGILCSAVPPISIADEPRMHEPNTERSEKKTLPAPSRLNVVWYSFSTFKPEFAGEKQKRIILLWVNQWFYFRMSKRSSSTQNLWQLLSTAIYILPPNNLWMNLSILHPCSIWAVVL